MTGLLGCTILISTAGLCNGDMSHISHHECSCMPACLGRVSCGDPLTEARL